MANRRKIIRIRDAVKRIIVSRVNRFVVKVQLEGVYYGARSNNTGRLPKFLVDGRDFAHKIGKNTEFLCRNHIFLQN